MIYLFNNSQKYNYIPYTHYYDCLQNFFKNLNIKTEIIDNNNKITEKDLVFFFIMDSTGSLIKKKSNYICIYTEGFFIPNKEGKNNGEWYKYALEQFNNILMVWDYTYKNLNKIKNQIYLPLLYNISLEKKFVEKKKYDFMFFGQINDKNQRRLRMINTIKENVSDKFLIAKTTIENHYRLIQKAKIVLVIHYYLEDFPIDYYRIASLISNKVFIIHEDVQEEDKISKEYKILSESLVFCKYEEMAKTCKKCIEMSQEERDRICEKTYENFKAKLSFENYIPIKDIIPYTNLSL